MLSGHTMQSFCAISVLFLQIFSASLANANTSRTYSVEDWEELVKCSSSKQVVTGFQLSFDYLDPNNQEDKTILNGIWIGCGPPFQSELQQESSVEWLSGAGNATSAVGIPEQKIFCGGYAAGFRLRQVPSRLYYNGDAGADAGVINVKIICNDDEEVEGHEEKWDYYPAAQYSLQPLACGHGEAVCGVQTQMKDIKLVGDASTNQLKNLKVHCCPVPTLPSSVQPTELPMTTTTVAYESPFTPHPQGLNVTLFENADNTSEHGRHETITIKSGQCNPIPESWRSTTAALHQKSACVRLWQTETCGGHTRCYCDSDYLALNRSFQMSRNESWYGNLGALTTCFLEDNQDYTRAMIFSARNYTGDQQGVVILQQQECLTFYEGDRWHNRISSLIVTDGCLEYFNGEECTGKSEKVDRGSPRNILGEEWERRVKSLRNCHLA